MSQVAPAPRRSPVAAFFVGLWDVANFTRKLVLNLIFSKAKDKHAARLATAGIPVPQQG